MAASGSDVGDSPSISAQISQIKNEIHSVKSRKGLSEAVRAHTIDNYQKALSALQAAQADRRQTQQLNKAAQQAPSQIDAAQKQLRDLGQPPTLDTLSSVPSDKLSKRVEDTQHALADAQSRLSDLRDKLTRIAQLPAQLRESLADARSKLQSLATDNTTNTDQAGGIRSQASNALASARREALNAKIERIQQELSGLDSRERLLEANRSLAEAQVAHENEVLATLRTALSRQQTASANSLKSQSEDKLSELRTSLGPISNAAQKNVQLTHQLSKLTQDTESISQRQADQRAQVDNLERRLNLVQRQLEIGGGSVALGDVLRSQRRKLATPSSSFLPSSSESDMPDISTAELNRFQLQQDRAELDNPNQAANRLANKAGVRLDPGQRESLVNLLQQRRTILDQLIDAEGRYINVGRDLKSLSQQYNNTLTSFNRLLDERLFWLPSFHAIGLDWPRRVVRDLPWLLNPASWRATVSAFFAGIVARPFLAGASALFFAVLIALRRPMRRRMRELGEPVGNVSRDSIWLTLRVVLITALLALPSIVLPLIIGYLIDHAPGASRFARAAAAGIFQLGMLWLFIEPFASICRPHGLADRHFRWPASARRGLHRNLRWLLYALIVPLLMISITESFDDDAKRETLGRAAFMLGEIWIAIFAWRVVHPVTGALADVMTEDDGSHWRLGYLWLPLATAIPLALSGMAARGYYYTALQLQSRFFYSAALLGGAVIVYSLIVRWLTVAERRLALVRARRRREEAREARASREVAAMSGDSAPENLEALEIDLVQISEQTRGLIKVVITLLIGAGLWVIWSGTFPALQLLNNVNLWQYTTRVDNQAVVNHVTLGALLLSVAVGVITALAGRNLPGFLEIALLRRFSLDAGSRYAMATLFQYAIVILGLLVAVNLIGLRWSSIQWLVAAVGVGLGFGLQQIFANFISGILILFERPVRVGDTVTVGTLTGTVSRIRIRATTITDWDNKEVVIPNQTFITETVINWTLTDDITRLILRFCVALNSDGDLVERLINEAIDAEPVALDTPAPSVFMVGYNDNAMIYEARVFYHDLYYMLPLQHALYRRVHKAFDEHGIRIVYPQHDLHLRSVDESVSARFGRADKGRPPADDAPPSAPWEGPPSRSG